MNYSNVLFLIDSRLKAVRVAYEPGSNRNDTTKRYREDKIGKLAVNDYVLVETETRHNATVCRVSQLGIEVDPDSEEKVGWVFGKVDLQMLDDLKAEEEQAIALLRQAENRKRKEEIRGSILALAGDDLKALPSFTIGGSQKAEG